MDTIEESADETFRVERRGDVDWLTLDRPDALNAMNARMIAELAEYFGARVHDEQTRVIVLRATGSAFCVGLDLREMTGLIDELDTAGRLRFQQRTVWSDLVVVARTAAHVGSAVLRGMHPLRRGQHAS